MYIGCGVLFTAEISQMFKLLVEILFFPFDFIRLDITSWIFQNAINFSFIFRKFLNVFLKNKNNRNHDLKKVENFQRAFKDIKESVTQFLPEEEHPAP